MKFIVLATVYLIFFLSGSAALIYEVVWVRYLSLVFGGSHLAVTTVLAVFMGGLALGSYQIGKRIGRYKKLLRLYGFLELGIAASALVFMLLMKLYPSIYIPLAQLADTSPLYLTFLRVTFAVIAMIVPTTLMGGTLPVLSSFVSGRAVNIGTHLSFLYGINTLGAVAGASAAGFILLRHFTVSTTMSIALLINVVVGTLCILLQDKAQAVLIADTAGENVPAAGSADTGSAEGAKLKLSLKLVLWGVGVSGFCALGYEVLWTRVLSIAIGASTYGFTIMLAAFLSGIAVGSAAYGLVVKMLTSLRKGAQIPLSRTIAGFGLIQLAIGLTALVVTTYIRDLPVHAIALQGYFLQDVTEQFQARQWANLALAFSYMFVPAFFMGVAFPMAGRVHAVYKEVVGHAVGEVLAFNTVGAVLGSAVSGFVLTYLLGIERSLQIIALINLGFGLLVLVSLRNSRMLAWGVSGAVLAIIMILAFNPRLWRVWDPRFLAMYQANSPGESRTPRSLQDNPDKTEILYYAEGAEAIVSSIKGTGGEQSFLTNGRVEATNFSGDMQCQYTLGHLPMLLHKNPRKVFVLGTGSGMTLGATSVHPSVEQITLAELEPKVLGVARTFARYNHNALDNPKLKIVFNDGRNFLMTTREKFDVITADPVHPWFSGAGYLYTSEYFKLAAGHLNPGGIICQWLPIYELTGANLKSILKSLNENFKYTMVWLTHYDAEIIGSNSPIIIDEADLAKRIAEPEIRRDLERVGMGSARDFLSYFLMGNVGTKAYGAGGKINTDENLYLEFSAPESIGNTSLVGLNCSDLVRQRESIIPYLKTPADGAAALQQKKSWAEIEQGAVTVDQAHCMYLAGWARTPEFAVLMAGNDALSSSYAPWLFLKNEYMEKLARDPKLLQQTTLALADEKGNKRDVQIAAVISRMTREYAVIDFVNNSDRIVYGQLEVRGENRDAYINSVTSDIMKNIREVHKREQNAAIARGEKFPRAASLLPSVKNIITLQVLQNKP